MEVVNRLLLRPLRRGQGLTKARPTRRLTVPTASQQGLRPCTLAPAAGFRLRRAMLDPACGVLFEKKKRKKESRKEKQKKKEKKKKEKFGPWVLYRGRE